MRAGLEAKAPLPLAAAVPQLFLGNVGQGEGGFDDSHVIRTYRAMTGQRPRHAAPPRSPQASFPRAEVMAWLPLQDARTQGDHGGFVRNADGHTRSMNDGSW